MTLMRWDPWRGFEHRLGRLVDAEGSWPFSQARYVLEGNLALDVADDGGNYVVTASLPGFKPEEVEVTVSDRTVTVTAETKAEDQRTAEAKRYVVRERFVGKLARSVTLPDRIDSSRSVATHEHGVLTLTLPKNSSDQAKRLPVVAA